MMGPKYVTDYDKKKAVADYKQGASLRDVGRAHGVSYQAVRLWILAAGEKMRPKGYRTVAKQSRTRRLEALLAACLAAPGPLTAAIGKALEDLGEDA